MSPTDTKEDHGSQEPQQQQHGGEHPGDGRSGEGAASAMQHMISQGRQHRHQSGEADDAPGGRGQ